MTYYSTVTSKGQITLPARIRKDMNLKTGQKVSITQGIHDQVNIEIPPSLDDIRAQLQSNLKKQGFTPNKLRKIAEEYKSGDGFASYVGEKYGTHR
ncbi:MAG TPA: AbrB/MazE/SpoVT family DNA-binding domain-containing protein [Candidatus Saccharimonadales bacterium]|jgi:AbrB family looped-hinge helix DNA binding protein